MMLELRIINTKIIEIIVVIRTFLMTINCDRFQIIKRIILIYIYIARIILKSDVNKIS